MKTVSESKTTKDLLKILKDLVREAQAVADDHHKPRYFRLDQALESARDAIAKVEAE